MRKCWDIPDENMFRFSGPDWLLILLDGIDNERRGLVLLLLWRCWHMRNDAIHDKGKCTIKGSATFLNQYTRDLNLNYTSCNSEKGKRHIISHCSVANESVMTKPAAPQPGKTQCKQWSPPPEGWVKINCDASYDSENSICSIACICRDRLGRVTWACNESNIKCFDVPEAEARACLLGLKSVHDITGASIILESDNALVIEAIKKRNQKQSRLWKLFEDINFLSDTCRRFEATKIERESNSAAHVLADVARFSDLCYFWLGHVPSVVGKIVERESVKLISDVI
uniref:Uncharacterized protein n=1 Tax=Avena sativa TaxID=4498 RepID=A0ACD5W8Q4_AVESA